MASETQGGTASAACYLQGGWLHSAPQGLLPDTKELSQCLLWFQLPGAMEGYVCGHGNTCMVQPSAVQVHAHCHGAAVE